MPSFEEIAISLAPTRCIYELIRDKNRLLQIIGNMRFGKHCGYPLCCRLEFSLRFVLQPGAHLAVLNRCHPSSPKWTGCDADFVHCKWHAWRGHKKQRCVSSVLASMRGRKEPLEVEKLFDQKQLTAKDIRTALKNDIAAGRLRTP